MNRAYRSVAASLVAAAPLIFWASPGFAQTPHDQRETPDAWTFVSIPDFLNFDIEYPQMGWENVLGFIMRSIKNEQPAFVMADAVPFYKDAFRRHLAMPLHGPEQMKCTAFYWVHRNALFVSVDVFEKGNGGRQEIV